MVIKLSGTSLDEKFFSKFVIGKDSRRQVRSVQLNRRRQFQFVISNLAHCCFIFLKSWLSPEQQLRDVGILYICVAEGHHFTFCEGGQFFNLSVITKHSHQCLLFVWWGHLDCRGGSVVWFWTRYTLLPLYLRDGGQFRSILWIPICSLSHLLPFPTFLLNGNTLGSISAIDPASCVLLAMPSLIKTIQHMNHLKTLAPSLSLTNLSICSSLPKPAPHLRLYDAA